MADTGNPPPPVTYEYVDNPGLTGLTYCYVVTSVAAGDEGAGSPERTATVGSSEGPMITGANMFTDFPPSGFKEANDSMLLDFEEAATETDTDNVLTEQDVEAILGTAVTLGATSSVTIAQVDTDTIRLTVGSDLDEGVAINDPIPGGSNTIIVDADGKPQRTNPTPTNL